MADRNNNWNSDTTCGAMNLLRQIDFEFVCLLEIGTDVLISLDCTNKSLQGKTVTHDIASSLLSGLAKKIKYLREQGVRKYTDKAKLICASMSIKHSFTEKRLGRVKKMAGEMAEDEAHLISPDTKDIFNNACQRCILRACFSKLKMIKNYLRSTICETRLTNLAICQ